MAGVGFAPHDSHCAPWKARRIIPLSPLEGYFHEIPRATPRFIRHDIPYPKRRSQKRIKNWHTIAARALKRIDSPYAFVLTGTPLENKLEELISVIQFVAPYRLGPTWKLLHDHQLKNESGRVVGYTGLERIGAILAPIMIRRRKSEVLAQLPERTDQNLLVPMTEMQIIHHHDGRTGGAARRPVRAAGDQGRGVQPMDAHA